MTPREHLNDRGETQRTAVIAAAGEAGFSESAIKRAARAVKVFSRDETGQHPNSGMPFRRSVWSLPQSGQSVPCRPTEKTGDPTGSPPEPDLAEPLPAGTICAACHSEELWTLPSRRTGICGKCESTETTTLRIEGIAP